MDNNHKNTPQAEENIDLDAYASLQRELNELKEEQGIIDEEKGKKKPIQKLVSYFFDSMEKKTLVNKKKYIWLACLTGVFGGHRFYSKKYKSAVIYLLLCWCGLSVAHTIIDLMVIIPMTPDENGNVEI